MSDPEQNALDEIRTRLDRLVARRTGQAPRRDDAQGDPLPAIRSALGELEAAGDYLCSAELAEQARLATSILAHAPMSIVACDVDGCVRVFSPGAEAMTGYRAAEMLGGSILRLHDAEELQVRARELSRELSVPVAADFAAFVARTRATGQPDEAEWTYLRKDGTRIKVLLSVSTRRDANGQIDGYVGVATDITERAQALAEVSRMAHHDQLTRIPNRRLFHDRMQVAISHARRENARLALMLIDLDGFKPVNDRLGHAVGDLLLKSVAQRMQRCLRESDTLARVGGDEFAVILPRVATGNDALVAAEKIRRAIEEPYELAGAYPLSISCSIGIAIYPEQGRDEKRLAKNADEAMYVAKAHGGNCTRLSTRLPVASGEPAASQLPLPATDWVAACLCGEAAIDRTRHEVFGRANELILAINSGQYDARQLHEVLDAFIACLARSLASEETILAQHQYSGLAAHVVLHQRLVGRAVEICHRLVELPLSEVLTFLAQDVIVKHLLEEDRHYYPVFRRAAPAERREMAGDER